MRLPLVAAALLASGCQSEEQTRQLWREATVRECVTQAQNSRMPPGVDAQQVCACSIDRIMQGRSADELLKSPNPAAAEEAARQCALEAMGATPPPVSTEPAANAAGNAVVGGDS